MDTQRYTAYLGGWQQGQNQKITRTYQTPSLNVYQSVWYNDTTAAGMTAKITQWLSLKSTVWCYEGYEYAFTALGFSDVRGVAPGVNYDYYITPTKYIRINTTAPNNMGGNLMYTNSSNSRWFGVGGTSTTTVYGLILPQSTRTSAKYAVSYLSYYMPGSSSNLYQLDISCWDFGGWAYYFDDADIYIYIPYQTGGITTGGETEDASTGGDGDYDLTSDPVDIPALPTSYAVDAGFITLYTPTLAQLNSLASYMWSSSLFDVSTWQKVFADPMSAILGLTVIPGVPMGSRAAAVQVGNITTTVNMVIADSQYIAVDCGELDITHFYGAYLDYAPYTDYKLYLPYIGIVPLSADDITGGAVRVVYHIDILTGACVAYVKCGDHVLYTYNGACGASIPLSGQVYNNIVSGVLTTAASVGHLAATGGISAPGDISNIASAAINAAKPSIEHSGNLSGGAGIMAEQTPYLIITRPRQALPDKQDELMGYPSFVYVSMGDLKGYNEVDAARLSISGAENAEVEEIKGLLARGVIF